MYVFIPLASWVADACMSGARSELDEVLQHLTELSSVIGITGEELSTFMRVLLRASWAHVEFEPIEGVEFEFKAISGDDIELEVRIRRDNTTIIKEYTVPEILLMKAMRPAGQRRSGRKKRARRRFKNKRS